jgi:hypothetical protein
MPPGGEQEKVMILRILVLAVGLSSGLAAAQFPAFSQAYLQRLGGAVQALEQVVADFDSSATALGLSREQALDQMRGSRFVEARRTDMEGTFARYDRLSGDLSTLEPLGPFMRAYHVSHMADAEIARGAWRAFEPALPLTSAAALFGLVGWALGSLGMGGVLSLRLRRRRRAGAALPA